VTPREREALRSLLNGPSPVGGKFALEFADLSRRKLVEPVKLSPDIRGWAITVSGREALSGETAGDDFGHDAIGLRFDDEMALDHDLGHPKMNEDKCSICQEEE
jgi:hypothetical protein